MMGAMRAHSSNNLYYLFLRGILVNKSGTSDGSGDQLTAWVETCYLLQTQAPDLNPVPGVTQSFAVFRAYKDRIPVFLRIPSASTEIFLRIVDMEIY
jgi:hypothetical protein